MPDFEYHGDLLLAWLYDRSVSGEIGYHDVDEFAAEQGISTDGLRSLLQHLERTRLVEALYPLGGHMEAMITAEGIARTQARRRTSAQPAHRARELRSSMLHWLYQQEANGLGPTSWADFTDSDPAQVLPGGAPRGEELEREAGYLAERSLVDAQSVEEAPHMLRPRLTADGRDCVTDHGGRVSEYLENRRSGGNTYRFTDINGNISVDSTRVTQTNTQTNTEGLDTSVILRFAGLVGQIAPTLGLTGDAQSQLQQQAQELHTEAASPTPEKGSLRRLFDQVLAGLNAAAQTAARDMALAASHDVVQALTAASGH